MSKYTFTFKKDDVFVDFSTTDRDAVERQFEIWVEDANDYVQNRPIRKRTQAESPVVNQELPAETLIVEQVTEPSEGPVSEIVEEKSLVIRAAEETTVKEEIAEVPEITEEAEPIDETEIGEPTEVFDKASSLLKTINTIQNQVTEDAQVPTEMIAKTFDFDAVLEKTIENPTFEPVRNKDQVFLNLLNSKNTSDKFHYLMITAYYLCEFEKLERFSLKQINSKLMQNLSKVIDHTMLQEAINQGFIELVPDLTGTSEVGEYRLTHLGEDFFANKI